MKIKLIASDIDGTLLPVYDQPLSEANRAAVRACAAHGILFTIATGRWYLAAKEIADQLGQVDGVMIIANGGAIVKPDGTPVMEWGLTPAQARHAYDVLRREDVCISAYVRYGKVQLNHPAEQLESKSLCEYMGGRYRVIEDDVPAFERALAESPYKLDIRGDDAVLTRLAQTLRADGYAISSAFPGNMEVMAGGTGKGTAVRWLASSIGATADECMAFGDNTNDRDMLDAVTWSVAMENGVEALKKSARIIAPNCADDGVAQIINRVIRGEALC